MKLPVIEPTNIMMLFTARGFLRIFFSLLAKLDINLFKIGGIGYRSYKYKNEPLLNYISFL